MIPIYKNDNNNKMSKSYRPTSSGKLNLPDKKGFMSLPTPPPPIPHIITSPLSSPTSSTSSLMRSPSKLYIRRRPTETESAKKLLPLDVDFVRRRRAVLNKNGEIEYKDEIFRAMEEIPEPPKPVTILGPTSWCRSVQMKQQLKLLIPKKCNEYDSVPMMPHNSQKFGVGQGEPIRDRDKVWRMDSFRKFFEGRGTIGRSTKKWKMKHGDFYGSDVVQWVDGFPLRQSLIHCESRMISNDYSLISVHGMGISGRVYNEGEARVPKFLQITVHTPSDCGKYEIRVMVKELPDLFADQPDLLLPGRKKKMCKELIKLCYFEYSNSDPVNLEDETPLFGGWGKDKYVPPQRDGEENDEDESKKAEDELLEDDSTLEAKAKSDEMVTDEKGNIIIRGADGKDHLMRPDLMKVLLISRGNKLNKRERRENWLKKRAELRAEDKLPSTPRPPPVPLRMVDRKYACGLRMQGMSFYASVYCYADRPGNYQFVLRQPNTGTKLTMKVGKFEVAKLVNEKRPARFWTKKLEKEILGKVCRMFDVITWQPVEESRPLQMAFRLGSKKSIPGNAYVRSQEAKALTAKLTYKVTSSRKASIAPKAEKYKRRFKLVREMVHGTRLYIGTIRWCGVKTIFDIFYKYHLKAEKITVRLYKMNQPYAIFEIVWRDFEVFLKDMHTLELLRKAKKKILKKKWKKLGYGGFENPIWGDAMRILLQSRIKLLNEEEEVNPLSRVVGHRPVKKKMLSKKTYKKKKKEKEKKFDEDGNVIEEEDEGEEEEDEDEDDDDIDMDDVDEFGNIIERETFNDQKKLENVTFCNRNISFDRRIFSRWIRVTDMRIPTRNDDDDDDNSTNSDDDSSNGGNESEDKEINEVEKKDGTKKNDEEKDSDEEDSGDDEEDDLNSIQSSEDQDDDSDDMSSMSDLDDDEIKSVYIQVTVHQREWRLFIVAYEPLERKYYYPKFNETMSRSLSNEFKKLDVSKRTVTLSVTVASMTMVDEEDEEGEKTGKGILVFQDEAEDDSSSDDSL